MDQDGDSWSAYNTQVEVFIALRNMDYCFSAKNPGFPRKCGRKFLAHQVVVYLKPPGSLQYVEKCLTETVYRETNPKFSTKLHFHCEERDASAISLKFDIQHVGFSEQTILGCVELTLDALLLGGYKGLDLPLLSPDHSLTKTPSRCQLDLGRVFLRAELLKPIDYSVLIKFGLKTHSARWKCFKRKIRPYYFEMYKSNEQMYFQMDNAYTLIYRSELIKHSGTEDDCWNFFILPVNQVCNGDLGRVLKLEIYQADEAESPKGFAMTTLRKMLIERELVIPVDELNGKHSNKICLYAPLCYEVPLHPFKYYLNKGLIVRRIYAVDFSSSNWDVQLHRRSLHDIDAGRTPYEEAIIMASGAIIDVAQGESVFYSFGTSTANPYVATFGQENHVRFLVGNYREALYGAKMASESTLMAGDEMDGNCLGASSCSAPMSVPNTALGSSSNASGLPGAQLAPLLNDIVDFVSVRAENFEYHVVFIFTDGNISDVEQSMRVIITLAKLPVSLIFIGVGRGDFRPLLLLEQSWHDPVNGECPIRKIVHLIHFRSLLDWDSSIRYAQFRSTPPDIFRKEILTVIRDQMPTFMRVTRAPI